MAIKAKFDFNGLEVKEAYLKIERLWGSSKEGWGSLISVNNIVIETIEDTETKEVSEIEVKKQITTFNHSCEFKQDERGYTTLYKSLQAKFGGVEI
jgi:hypothetical protein